MLLVPLLVSMLGSVAPADSPKASSFISLSVQLGGSITSTLLVTIFDRSTYFHPDVYRSFATSANPNLGRLLYEVLGTNRECGPQCRDPDDNGENR